MLPVFDALLPLASNVYSLCCIKLFYISNLKQCLPCSILLVSFGYYQYFVSLLIKNALKVERFLISC